MGPGGHSGDGGDRLRLRWRILWSAEQVLDRRGVQTEAVVVETDYVRRLPDEAVVHYRVDGLLRQATLTVSSAGDFEVG